MADAERMRGISEGMVVGWFWAVTYSVHEMPCSVGDSFFSYAGFDGDTPESRRALTFACRFLK